MSWMSCLRLSPLHLGRDGQIQALPAAVAASVISGLHGPQTSRSGEGCPVRIVGSLLEVLDEDECVLADIPLLWSDVASGVRTSSDTWMIAIYVPGGSSVLGADDPAGFTRGSGSSSKESKCRSPLRTPLGAKSPLRRSRKQTGAKAGDASGTLSSLQPASPRNSMRSAGRASTWLIEVVSGEDKLVRRAVTALGAAGAIRADFDSRFLLHWEYREQGPGSNVHRVLCRENPGVDSHMLAKVPRVKNASSKCEVDQAIRREVVFLAEAQRHPNIVRFHGLCRLRTQDNPELEPRWAMLIEDHVGGSVASIINSQGPLGETYVLNILQNVLLGLCHLHDTCDIIHRNVTAENVHMCEDGRFVLDDFGLACRCSDRERLSIPCGSPGYTAPEVLGGHVGSSKMDLFSVGVLTYLAFTGAMPFTGPSISVVSMRTMSDEVDLEAPTVAKVFSTMTQGTKEIISLLLDKSPTIRLSAEEAVLGFQQQGMEEPAPRHQTLHAEIDQLEASIAKLSEASLVSLGETLSTPSTLCHVPSQEKGRRRDGSKLRTRKTTRGHSFATCISGISYSLLGTDSRADSWQNTSREPQNSEASQDVLPSCLATLYSESQDYSSEGLQQSRRHAGPNGETVRMSTVGGLSTIQSSFFNSSSSECPSPMSGRTDNWASYGGSSGAGQAPSTSRPTRSPRRARRTTPTTREDPTAPVVAPAISPG